MPGSMTICNTVSQFLKDFKYKLEFYGAIYLDNRLKNTQSLFELGITTARRTEILRSLEISDYSEGPLEETIYGGSDMWVFGKHVNDNEVYIKITMGKFNQNVLCISFHIAEFEMKYPLKK
jgi:hypothetical protein